METVLIGKYEIREPIVGDVPDLFDLMTGGENVNMKSLVNELIRNCVYLEGAPIGDRISQIAIKDLRPIMNELLRMAGLSEKK